MWCCSPAVTLIFDLFPKPNKHYEPKYICHQNLVNFHSLVFEICCSQGFRVIVCCDLDLLTPKSQHVYEPKYSDQNWVKCPSLVFEIWCSQGFRDAQMHLRTHSLTDGQIRIHYATVSVTVAHGDWWAPCLVYFWRWWQNAARCRSNSKSMLHCRWCWYWWSGWYQKTRNLATAEIARDADDFSVDDVHVGYTVHWH